MLMFSHPSAKEVTEMYHEYIGGFKVPPLWYFGFHQSRWGYENVKKVSDIVTGYNKSKLKLESVFLDIDYMQDKKPFKIDVNKFPITELLELKKRAQIKIVPIVDYAFNYDFQSDLEYELKKQINSLGIRVESFFIKNFEGNVYTGKVWPGISIFPDFYHPNIATFWELYISHLREYIPFDGVWLDMNEIANFENQLVEL
jgi:alpha-glucosidase (family GH31 glycosyl hydrolase)